MGTNNFSTSRKEKKILKLDSPSKNGKLGENGMDVRKPPWAVYSVNYS